MPYANRRSDDGCDWLVVSGTQRVPCTRRGNMHMRRHHHHHHQPPQSHWTQIYRWQQSVRNVMQVSDSLLISATFWCKKKILNKDKALLTSVKKVKRCVQLFVGIHLSATGRYALAIWDHTLGWPQTWITWNTQGFLWTWKTQGILCNLGENL